MDRPHKRSTFVPADPRPRRVEIVDASDPMPIVPVAHTAVGLHTTYTDRAKGFQIATLPIAIAFGVGALFVAIVGYRVPVLSVGALAVFWLAFLGWWLIGWVIHHVASPDGVALVQALLMYRYVRREQKERHERLRRLADHDE